ncbi:SET2 [Candida oxycetoniae]|uniref:Histone-lysine N-methyltransferase, H3 lysine-36 specific n=1 Tax=Candida oxycetoniae TaxID=497107 RepID=A0AAI9SWQ7_9ASCO|nr:SET2 [Candida oxycetoniae]KAI3404494.2 SET2 [Candida oxycetoniae]
MNDGIKKKGVRAPQLFLDVEDKTNEALTKFRNLESCIYQTKTIGAPSTSKRGPEFMTCDCVEDWDGERQENLACGDDSNCINRITSVECVNRHCGCGDDCQNQRFQRRQYANVTVFQTELKGYGLKANSILKEGQFIYEYIGEIIDEPTFRQRMIEYDLKGYKHFYFMMLKNDAFIDATEKGSLARFVNHSCNPNAYVDKWVVGDKLRMGIFAKREIVEGEEITFDYNVDRYGAQSQPCYCGEPNCLKFMGGKRQTDAALLLPEGISEALGVNSRMEKAWLKENKHLRAEQQADDATINEMFVKSLTVEPMIDLDVSKVMAALLKAQQTSLIKKLIERMHKTDDAYINQLLVRFHGYKTLSSILQDAKDDELIMMILEIVARWPALTKNKISSSRIEDVVKDIQETNKNEQIQTLCNKLLTQWSKLQMAYRIPKITRPMEDLSGYGRVSKSPGQENTVHNNNNNNSNNNNNNNDNNNNHNNSDAGKDLPPNWATSVDPKTNKVYYYNTETRETRWDPPEGTTASAERTVPTGPKLPADYYSTSSGPNTNIQQQSQQQQQQQQQRPAGNYKHIEAQIMRREEEKIKKEKEAKLREMANKERQLQELIEQARLSSQKPTPEPEKNGASKSSGEHRHKRKHSSHGRHEHHHHSERKVKKENSIEQQWKHILAKHIPNLVKKHVNEIGKPNVKGCAKEIVNNLALREAKKSNAPPPSELDKHKLKKVKNYSDMFMEKFLVKYRTKHKKRKLEKAVKEDGEDADNRALQQGEEEGEEEEQKEEEEEEELGEIELAVAEESNDEGSISDVDMTTVNSDNH